MDGRFAVAKADHLGDRLLGRDRQQHRHVIGHQMPLVDTTLALLGSCPAHLAHMATELPVQRFMSLLRHEDHLRLAHPLGMA